MVIMCHNNLLDIKEEQQSKTERREQKSMHPTRKTKQATRVEREQQPAGIIMAGHQKKEEQIFSFLCGADDSIDVDLSHVTPLFESDSFYVEFQQNGRKYHNFYDS